MLSSGKRRPDTQSSTHCRTSGLRWRACDARNSSSVSQCAAMMPSSSFGFASVWSSRQANAKRRYVISPAGTVHWYTPTSASGVTWQPVSSSASRMQAATSDSPSSRWPAGWLKRRPAEVSSSTTRNRPSRSISAATVTLGFQRCFWLFINGILPKVVISTATACPDLTSSPAQPPSILILGKKSAKITRSGRQAATPLRR